MIVDYLSTTLFVVLVQWPAALATLPNGIAWVRLLYSVFILLGIQFPMAIVTAIVTVIREDRTSGIARYVQVTLCPRLLWSAEMRSKNRRPSLLLCILLFNRTCFFPSHAFSRPYVQMENHRTRKFTGVCHFSAVCDRCRPDLFGYD